MQIPDTIDIKETKTEFKEKYGHPSNKDTWCNVSSGCVSITHHNAYIAYGS